MPHSQCVPVPPGDHDGAKGQRAWDGRGAAALPGHPTQRTRGQVQKVELCSAVVGAVLLVIPFVWKLLRLRQSECTQGAAERLFSWHPVCCPSHLHALVGMAWCSITSRLTSQSGSHHTAPFHLSRSCSATAPREDSAGSRQRHFQFLRLRVGACACACACACGCGCGCGWMCMRTSLPHHPYHRYRTLCSRRSPCCGRVGGSNWETNFSLLYSVYSFPNTVLPFLGGFLVDKLGVRMMTLVSGTCMTNPALASQHSVAWRSVCGCHSQPDVRLLGAPTTILTMMYVACAAATRSPMSDVLMRPLRFLR
jgi:hypothetical protein